MLRNSHPNLQVVYVEHQYQTLEKQSVVTKPRNCLVNAASKVQVKNSSSVYTEGSATKISTSQLVVGLESLRTARKKLFSPEL